MGTELGRGDVGTVTHGWGRQFEINPLGAVGSQAVPQHTVLQCSSGVFLAKCCIEASYSAQLLPSASLLPASQKCVTQLECADTLKV